MKLDLNYPAIADLRRKAKQRIPHFAFEYLDSGTGSRELGVSENRQALDQVKFLPTILKGEIKFQLDQEFMGETFSYPFGIAPVGMAGAMWPGPRKFLRALLTNSISRLIYPQLPQLVLKISGQLPEIGDGFNTIQHETGTFRKTC